MLWRRLLACVCVCVCVCAIAALGVSSMVELAWSFSLWVKAKYGVKIWVSASSVVPQTCLRRSDFVFLAGSDFVADLGALFFGGCVFILCAVIFIRSTNVVIP